MLAIKRVDSNRFCCSRPLCCSFASVAPRPPPYKFLQTKTTSSANHLRKKKPVSSLLLGFLHSLIQKKNTEMASSNVTMLAFCVALTLSGLYTDGNISSEFSFPNRFLCRQILSAYLIIFTDEVSFIHSAVAEAVAQPLRHSHRKVR